MAERQDRLVAALSALPPGPPLGLICRCAVELLGVSACAVLLMSDDEAGSVAASYGPRVAAVEDLQFSLGEGPCLTAFRTGFPVLEPDITSAAARWPAFAPAAAEAGAIAVFALPLQVGAIRVGVLYVVNDRSGTLADDALDDAHGLAQLATMVILDEQQDGAGAFLDGNASDGWAHRAVVHQATGMVAAQLDIRLADALATLRAHAFSEQLSLYALSRDVIERRVRFSPDGEVGASHES